MRALRAHRRKSSWAAAGKYKWGPNDPITKQGDYKDVDGYVASRLLSDGLI
jgi:hypothetical protein